MNNLAVNPLHSAFALYQEGQWELCRHRFEAGWTLYNKRLDVYPRAYQSLFSPIPVHDSSFRSQRLLIVGDPDYTPVIDEVEQPSSRIIMGGFEAMYAQFFERILEQKPKSVTALMDERLTRLLQRRFGDIQFLPRESKIDDLVGQIRGIHQSADMVLPLASLGKTFVKNQLDIPLSDNPWLIADPALVEKHEKVLDEHRGSRIPVALSPIGAGIEGKSIDPSQFFENFLKLTKEFLFINFQYRLPPSNPFSNFPEIFNSVFGEKGMGTTNIDIWGDFENIAAMLTAIRNRGGLAVMIPNYTEHLAAALHVPVLMPLHTGRFWSEDVFCYPHVSTFMQSKPGDWQSPLRAIFHRLKKIADGETPKPARHDRTKFRPRSRDNRPGG